MIPVITVLDTAFWPNPNHNHSWIFYLTSIGNIVSKINAQMRFWLIAGHLTHFILSYLFKNLDESPQVKFF